MTHICVSKLTTIGSDNGLSPGRRQAIIRTNAGILLIEPLGTNFNEILIKIHIFSFKKIHLKMSSGKWRPFCLGFNVLTHCGLVTPYQKAHKFSLIHCGLIILGHHWFKFVAFSMPSLNQSWLISSWILLTKEPRVKIKIEMQTYQWG